MKNKMTFIAFAGSLLLAVFAAAQVSTGPKHEQTAAVSASGNDRLKDLIDSQMASEAALTAAERSAVAIVRADLTQTEAQQRTSVQDIRRDYRALSEAMTALHAADKKALCAQTL